MRKAKLLLLSLALMLSALALPASKAEALGCWCEDYMCLDYGDYWCSQDSCCQLHCCEKGSWGCYC